MGILQEKQYMLRSIEASISLGDINTIKDIINQFLNYIQSNYVEQQKFELLHDKYEEILKEVKGYRQLLKDIRHIK